MHFKFDGDVVINSFSTANYKARLAYSDLQGILFTVHILL